MIRRMVVFCSLLLLGSSFPAIAAEVRISAAASLTDAVKELLADYRQHTGGVKLLPNFAASGALARQIVAGAPADIYISANPKWMDYLQQQQLIADSTRSILAHNRLVVVGRPDSRISTMSQLTDLSLIAICSPKSSPAGKYAEQALTAAGVYPQLTTGQQLVLAKDVRQALLYADRGEVDAAFVYRTDALLAKQAGVLFEVPLDLYPQVAYPAALTRAGAENSAARNLYAYLSGPEAQQVFRSYGFLVP